MWDAKVVGYPQALRAVSQFDPNLARDVRLEINRAARDAVRLARDYIPADPNMSGWNKANYPEGSRWYDRAYSAGEIRRGIQVFRGKSSRRSTRGWHEELGIENRTAAGMIYELAGSKSEGKDARGAHFIRQIASTGLRTPLRRLVVRAGVEEGPRAKQRIMDALRRLEAATNRVTA